MFKIIDSREEIETTYEGALKSFSRRKPLNLGILYKFCGRDKAKMIRIYDLAEARLDQQLDIVKFLKH